MIGVLRQRGVNARKRPGTLQNPAPQDPAESQTVAAVVSPRTVSLLTKMTPAPMNPIPETIWAAMREGSGCAPPAPVLNP